MRDVTEAHKDGKKFWVTWVILPQPLPAAGLKRAGFAGAAGDQLANIPPLSPFPSRAVRHTVQERPYALCFEE